MERNAWRMKGEADGDPFRYSTCGLNDVYLAAREDRGNQKQGFKKTRDGLHAA